MTDVQSEALDPQEIIEEAERRLAALSTNPDIAVADAARGASDVLREPETAPVTDDEQKKRLHGFAAGPLLFGGSLAGAALTENSPWGTLWHWLGLPDTQVLGTVYLQDVGFAVVFTTIVVIVIVLFWQSGPTPPAKRRRHKKKLKKLARAVKSPKYQSGPFKCLGDFDLCCSAKKQTKVCFALAAICITKEFMPFAGGDSKS
jgi:hypothetical protein